MNPLRTFRLFEITIAIVCMAIPALLRLADSGYPGFRPSISDYVYMPRSYIFGMLLTVGAMLFIYNGAVYFNNERVFGLNSAGKWYNVVLGLSLIGIILLPYKQHVALHYSFAGIFFVGNALVTAFFHRPQFAVLSIALAVLTLVAIVLHFWGGFLSLLAAEWISLTVIGIHFILEATGVIDPLEQQSNILQDRE